MHYLYMIRFFFFKQKTAYEMRISDWSSDVCSSDLLAQKGANVLQLHIGEGGGRDRLPPVLLKKGDQPMHRRHIGADGMCRPAAIGREPLLPARGERVRALRLAERQSSSHRLIARDTTPPKKRSEEHTSELQSLIRIQY